MLAKTGIETLKMPIGGGTKAASGGKGSVAKAATGGKGKKSGGKGKECEV